MPICWGLQLSCLYIVPIFLRSVVSKCHGVISSLCKHKNDMMGCFARVARPWNCAPYVNRRLLCRLINVLESKLLKTTAQDVKQGDRSRDDVVILVYKAFISAKCIIIFKFWFIRVVLDLIIHVAWITKKLKSKVAIAWCDNTRVYFTIMEEYTVHVKLKLDPLGGGPDTDLFSTRLKHKKISRGIFDRAPRRGYGLPELQRYRDPGILLFRTDFLFKLNKVFLL